jgi:hypothetical protein
MARKTTSARVTAKTAIKSPTAPPPRASVTTGVSDSNRLLREAAWSRMFGRVESKNPFTR